MRAASPLFCLALLSCAAGMQAGPRYRPAIAITDVTIIDVEHGGSIGPRTVVIDDGRIAAIAAPGDARIPPQAERVDGRGRFLIPGLVDMHVHLFNGSSRRPPNDWAFPLFIARGVTAVREMNAPLSSIATVMRWRSAADRGELIAPRIVAAGVAVRGSSPRDAADQVNAACDAGADFIKIYSELPASHWRAVLEAAAARSKAVAGHVPSSVALGVAAAAGQRSNEHLMQAYEACSSVEAPLLAEREGLDGDAAVARRDAQEAQALEAFDRDRCEQIGAALAATGQAQVPTLVLPYVESTRGAPPDSDPRWRYLRPDERVRWERILASVAAHADPLASRRWQVSREIVAAFHRTGVSLLAGTDTPMPAVYPGFALHEEMALLVEAGLTPLEALRAATLAPARFLGLAAVTGSVAVGKRADLVLLDADPTRDIRNSQRISAVVLDGHLLRRPALDALLEAAARTD
jgi:imidazolonepropionase-like amidohydrolase